MYLERFAWHFPYVQARTAQPFSYFLGIIPLMGSKQTAWQLPAGSVLVRTSHCWHATQCHRCGQCAFNLGMGLQVLRQHLSVLTLLGISMGPGQLEAASWSTNITGFVPVADGMACRMILAHICLVYHTASQTCLGQRLYVITLLINNYLISGARGIVLACIEGIMQQADC